MPIIRSDQTCVEMMRGQFGSDALNRLEGVICPEPGGAFYVFPDVSDTYEQIGVSGSTEWANRLLEDAHVGAVPGSDVGDGNCVRRRFATSMDSLDESLRRMEAFLE